MPSVDQRVVQMVFDKGNFESAVKSVINTLDNLKKNLNLDKASKEFEKIDTAAKDVDLSYIAESVDALNKRFSTMGIVGISVLNNLATTAFNAGKQILGNITNSLIEGGKRRALNLEQAKFQINGLGQAWEDVKKDVDYAVDGTAYGLDVAAKAAGQLLASGIEVGDNLKNSLRGISGVAAMTNSSYEDIADVFITVAGNGRLMGSELTRLSARGINAAATLAKYLNISEAEVRDMTSKGQIDFQTFANAMDSAFGEHAKEANSTFTGALSNMKAALSRIGAEFATPAYEHMREVLNSLRLVANEVKNLIQPLVTSATQGMSIVAGYLTWAFGKITTTLGSEGAKGAMEQLNRIVVAIGTSLWNLYRTVRNILRPIGEAFAQAFGGTLLEILAKASEGIEQFTRSLALNARMEDNLRKTFVGVFTILSAVLDVIGTVVGTVAGVLSSTIVSVFGFFADILLRIGAFLGDVILKIKEFVEGILQLEAVQTIMKTVSEAFSNVGKFISDAFENLHKFVNAFLDATFENSIGIFEGMGAVIQAVAGWLSDAYLKLVDWINKIKELPIVQGTIKRINEAFANMGEHISTAASFIKNSLVTAYEKAREVISGFISVVKDLIGNYIQLPSLQEGVAQFQQFVVDAFNNSKDVFEFIKEVVTGVIEKIKELTGVGFEKVLDNFAKLRARIKEVVGEINNLEDVKTALKNVGNFFGTFSGTIGGFINQVKSNISSFIEWVKTKISGITIGEILAAGTAGSFMAFFLSLASFLHNAKAIVIDFAKFSKEFSKIPKTINDTIKSWNKNANYDKVKERIDAISGLVKSVAILAGALMLLANVDPVRLITAASVLGALMAAMVLLSTFMTNSALANPKAARTLANMGPMFMMLAGSIAILAVALRMIAKLDVSEIIKGLFAITVALGELVAAALIISHYGKEVTVGASTILALAGAMILMAGAIAVLGLIPTGNLLKAITAIGVLLTVTALAARIASTGEKGSFATIIGLALSMVAMVAAIKLAANLSTADFLSGLFRLVTAVGVIAMLSKAISKAGPYALQAGAAIAFISASFILLGAAFKILATIQNGDIMRSMAVLTACLGVFALMAAMTRLAGQYGKSAGIAIAAMSASMILIAGAISILAQIDPAGLARATLAVDTVIGMFALLVAATGKAGQASKTIAIVAVAVAALAGAIAVLSLIEPGNLLAATVAIDTLILSFAALVAATSVVKQAYKTIILLTLVVGALAAVIKALVDANPEGALQVALGLGALIAALSVAMLACAAVGAIGPAAFLGIGVMAGVFIAILGLMALVSLINQLTKNSFEQFLRDSIPILEAVGDAIGSLYGHIVGSFLESASSGLATFGQNLQLLVDALVPFIEQIKGIDQSAISSINTMIDMVIALAAADFINALTNFMPTGSAGSSLAVLGEQLPQFGEALKAFSDSLGDVNTENLNKAAQAGKALADMAATIPKEGGWLDNIFGKSDMSQFGNDLTAFGNALKEFGDVAEDVKVDAVNKMMEPTRSLIELANLIPDTGGFITVFTGDNDFASFGENLVAYGNAVKDFGNILGEGVNYQAISDVMQPTKDLIEIAKTIEEIGGFGDAFTGADDLGTFGANLATFGGTFQIFAGKISEIPAGALDKVPQIIDIISGLANAAKDIPTSGGIFSWFTGDNGLDDFGIQLPNLGYGLAEFAKKMDGVDPSKITDSLPAIKGLVEISNELQNSGGLEGLLTGNMDKLKNLGDQLGPLGAGLRTYSAMVDGLNVGAIQNSIPAIEAMSQAAQKVPGLLEVITRMPGIIGFPVMAAALGSGISKFSSSLDGVDVGAAQQGAQAAEALAQAASSMPGILEMISTWLATLLGGSFSEACTKLAEGVKSFSDGMDGVSLSKVTVGVTAIETLQGMSANYESFSKIKVMGTDLKSFGENFKAFYNNISENVDPGKLEEISQNLTNFSNTITEFAQNMSQTLGEQSEALVQAANDLITGLTDAFITNQEVVHTAAFNMVNQVNIGVDEALASTAEKFDGVGERLVATLVEGLRAGGDSVGQAVLFIMQWALDTLNGKIPEFNSKGQELMNAMAQGLTTGGTNVKNAIMTILTDAETYIRSRVSTFQELGRTLMNAMASGVTSGAHQLRTAVQSAVDGAANRISTSAFYSAGQNIAQGLADGMRSKLMTVTAAATELSQAASLASNSALGIKSPSRVFMKIGNYVGEGLAKGIANSTHVVESRSIALANSAVKAMSIIADTIDEQVNNMEYTPTITPVLDSSKLQGGILGVNNLLDTTYGIGSVNSALNQMNSNSLMAMENQNGMKELEKMLDSKFDALVYAVSDIEINPITDVYLDGKELANGISRPMNRALGKIAKRGGIT